MSLVIIPIFDYIPFIAIPLLIIGIIMDKKHKFIYGILLALLLAIIAYNFNPKEEHDLYRYYSEIENYYQNINIERFVQKNMFNNTKFLFVILEFIVAQIGNNRLLPFIITFIGYSLTFYMILDYSKIKKIRPLTTIVVLFTFILTFYHINFISGLAQYLAIVIGFFAFYMEYVKQKKKWYYKILYVIPMLIHLSMIIIPCIRLLMCFNFKKIKKFYIILLLIYALLPNLIYQIINLIPNMSMIAYKINSYMLNEDSIFIMAYDIGTLILLIFYILIYYTSRKKLKDEIGEEFSYFIEIILLFNIFSIPYRSIFSRLFNISLLSMNLYLLVYLQKIKRNQLLVILFIIMIFAFIFGRVNLNIILDNDFNGIFSDITQNISYYFKT